MKLATIKKIDNGFVVVLEEFDKEDEKMEESSVFCKNLAKVNKQLKAFFNGPEGNVIPF